MKKSGKYLLFLIPFAFIVFLIYSFLEGNPIAKYNAGLAVEKYLKESYPEEEFTIEDPTYNFKGGDYNVMVVLEQDGYKPRHLMKVGGFFGTSVFQDGVYEDRLDDGLIRKFKGEAEKELRAVLEASVDVVSITAIIEVMREQYPEGTLWTKDLALEKPLELYIALDGNGKDKDDSLEEAKRIQQALNENGYKYGQVTADFLVKNQEEDYISNYKIVFKQNEEIDPEKVIGREGK